LAAPEATPLRDAAPPTPAPLRGAASPVRGGGTRPTRAPSQPSLFDAAPADPAAREKRTSADRARGVAAARASADLAEGHRERLRARFDSGETLPDYELLELLLFRSLPRVDTKPIAKALIREFGSFAAAIAAPAQRLMAIPGLGERAASDFRLVRAAAERFTHGALAEKKTLSSTDAVADFFRTRLRTADREEFHVLFLDRKNQFLAAERAAVGTVDHTPVYPREVMRRALELAATAVVLVHNHPSGDPTPSRADVVMTQKIIEAGAALGIAVHDHLIVGANRCLSLRAEGLI
jgi:DNA repair protein RadC